MGSPLMFQMLMLELLGERISAWLRLNIAEFLLDVTDNFTLSSGSERIATLSKDFHEVIGELTASQVQTEDGMGKSITLVDGDIVGDTIARVHDHTSGTTRGIEG